MIPKGLGQPHVAIGLVPIVLDVGGLGSESLVANDVRLNPLELEKSGLPNEPNGCAGHRAEVTSRADAGQNGVLNLGVDPLVTRKLKVQRLRSVGAHQNQLALTIGRVLDLGEWDQRHELAHVRVRP